VGSNPTLGAFLPAKFEHPCPDAAVHSTVSSDHKIRTKISLHTSSYRLFRKIGLFSCRLGDRPSRSTNSLSAQVISSYDQPGGTQSVLLDCNFIILRCIDVCTDGFFSIGDCLLPNSCPTDATRETGKFSRSISSLSVFEIWNCLLQ
jgi:hypothetical protein